MGYTGVMSTWGPGTEAQGRVGTWVGTAGIMGTCGHHRDVRMGDVTQGHGDGNTEGAGGDTGDTWGEGPHAHRALPFPRKSSNKATMSGSMTDSAASPVPVLSPAATPSGCPRGWDCCGCPSGPSALLQPGGGGMGREG